MADIWRIAPLITDADIISFVGDGATTTQVATRFAWHVGEARGILRRLQREGKLVAPELIPRSLANVPGTVLEWRAAENSPEN